MTPAQQLINTIIYGDEKMSFHRILRKIKEKRSMLTPEEQNQMMTDLERYKFGHQDRVSLNSKGIDVYIFKDAVHYYFAYTI